MIPKLGAADYVHDHTIYGRFVHGTEATLDLACELWDEAFERLRCPQVFFGFRLDKELNTVTNPTRAGLAHERLYERSAPQQADIEGWPSGGPLATTASGRGGRDG